jgi:hypothetical protein
VQESSIKLYNNSSANTIKDGILLSIGNDFAIVIYHSKAIFIYRGQGYTIP